MALNKGHKVSNRKVKPRERFYGSALAVCGIRKDAQTLSFAEMREGYKTAVANNPKMTAKEKKEATADLLEVVSMFEDYIENIHDNFDQGTGFLVMGNNDNGKTTLGGVWAKEAYRHRYDVKVISMEDISTLSRQFDDDEAQAELDNLIHKYDFLVIDEVGKETEGEKKFNITVLEKILKSRIEKYELPTMVVTNLNADDFRERYGNTIYSLLRYLEAITLTYSLYFRKPRKIVRSNKR